jgi:hypothetical protein
MSGGGGEAVTAEDIPRKRERPESQPSIDPLSLHIIRRVSHRVNPEESYQVPDVEVTAVQQSDEQEHLDNSISEEKPDQQQQLKAGYVFRIKNTSTKYSNPSYIRKPSLFNRFGRKKNEHRIIPENEAEGRTSENSDVSSVSSFERRHSIDSQKSFGRSTITTATRNITVAPHGKPIVKASKEI